MKILHVITTINLGGAENHLSELVRQQVLAGHDVKIVYLKGNHYWKSFFNNLSVDSYCLEIESYFFLYRFFKLKKILKNFYPDIVHAHMPPAELVTRLALIFDKKTKFVISKHNDEPFAPKIKNLFLANWVGLRASKIICISDAVLNYMKQWANPKLSNRLVRVYYGIDLARFSKEEKKMELRENSEFVVGTVARLMPQKSLDTLIKAFAVTLSKKPNALLVLVGIGPLETQLKKLASDLGISSSVRWLGARDDVPSILKSLDVFVLPSIYEGFGLVLLEAMSCRVPIIASNVSAIPEVLNHGQCGLLFKPKDVVELSHCIDNFLTSENRENYLNAAWVRVRETFDSQIMAKNTENIYFEILR